jgi:hypothetical protein
MADLMFYKKLVPLNKNQHRNHSFKKFDDLGFAAQTQTVILTGSEFPEACKEYPIVFLKTSGGSMMPVALLSFRVNENLYVSEDGKWNSRYIPAYVRRYPFIFFEASAEKFVVGIDEGCSAISDTGEGDRLFDDQGESSAFVNNMIQFMKDYQVDFLRTRTFMDRLQQLDILKEQNAQFTTNDGAEFFVNGIWMVDESKLTALSDDNLLQLLKTGDLGRIYAHLISMSNFNLLPKFDAEKTSP